MEMLVPTPHHSLKRAIMVRVRSFGLQNDSIFFIQNLSVLVSAGLGIPSALQSIYEEIRSPRLRSAIHDIQSEVDDGLPFSVALEHAYIVAPHILTLIRIGELSGRLSDNLEIASQQNEKEALFRSRVRSALSYSAFVLVIAIVVGVGTAWYILPQIATFFSTFNVKLPLITRIIIGIGSFLHTYGFIFIPVFGILVLGVGYFLFSFPKTRFIGHTILFHIPIIRSLILETEIARFGFLTGTMLRAGISLPVIFDLLPATTTFGNYRELYDFMGLRLKEGLSFKRLFPEYKALKKVMPYAVRQMIVTAEASGTLSETFLKIGTMYEVKVESTSRNIPAFLEPALLLIIGGIVGVLALGVIMPVYEIGLHF